MVATDPLRYRGTLPERYAQRLKPGLSITLNLASLPNSITASITRVSPTLEDQSRVISFEADIANPDQAIRAGLFAEAEVVIAPEATAIAVPATAVDSFAGVQKVWKVVDDRAVEQEVLIGMKRNDRFEITSGLEPGDEIIVDASKGKRAKVIRTETLNTNQLTPSNESNN
jgi:RND family efflux transporter MFP subunit